MTAVEFETGYVNLIARQFRFLSTLHESELHKYLASSINKITDHESKDKTCLMESHSLHDSLKARYGLTKV